MAAALLVAGAVGTGSAGATVEHMHIICAESSLCAEVVNYADGFGANYYVGHDEPTAAFHSDLATACAT